VQGIRRATTSLFTAARRIAPALGRRAHGSRKRRPGHRVAVISDGVWRSMFGRRRLRRLGATLAPDTAKRSK
jgi:hypothetical protein